MSPKQTYRERAYAGYSLVEAGADSEQRRQSEVIAAQALLKRVRHWLPRDQAVEWLDVGCGRGALLETLLGAGYSRARGVDASPEQVGMAATRAGQVQCADAREYLAAHRGRFDVISAIDLVEHFDRTELFEFTDLLYAALKPGGLLLLQTPNAASPFFGSVRYGDLTHELAFSPPSLAGLLTLSGFIECEAVECGPYPHGLASAARWLVWRLLRLALVGWNLIETGSPGDGVWTRVFLLKARKPF